MRHWTPEETEYLCENWGRTSIDSLASHLGRSRNAILIKKNKLGLGAFLDSGEYVSLNQLIVAVTGNRTTYSYKMTSWVKNRGLPVKTKKVGDCRWRIVYLKDFWKWAEKNKSFIDWSKMEPLILGKEPDWVAQQRKKDYHAFSIQRKDPWTKLEDDKLKTLLKQHKYGYAELSHMLNRSAGAIQRRCNDLGIKERPVKADNRVSWTAEDFEHLAEGIHSDDSYMALSEVIGRSEKAIRGKVYFVYYTEDLDKVRAMMGQNEWGYGAPEPTVKVAFHISNHRTETRKQLQRLTDLLLLRRNALGYEPYWQRHMCAKWDDIKGCAADCTDCDSCTEFERIRPQYCVRCGGTFFERQKQNICEPCRGARKKQHQRKWAVMQGKKKGA